jgi:2'-deoxynucleoside 5'-phosphate N-hydrolase
MKTSFLSISYKNRINLQEEVAAIEAVLNDFGISLLVFVDKYQFKTGEEKEMMQTACTEIQAADFLIAEVSEKAIGVGIEVGFASALQKTVIYLRKEGTEYSTTIGGIANHQIVYANTQDLIVRLSAFFLKHGSHLMPN